jgi:transposase
MRTSAPKAKKVTGSQHPNKRCPTPGKNRAVNASILQDLEQLNLRAAGIDVGSSENYVCVPAHLIKQGEAAVRSFGVFNAELDATVEWLKACGVTTAAMEATSVYWMALFDKLENAGIQVVLVEPRSVKQVPGRKSDVLDCQWLQQLHTYGLLRASFRPEGSIRRLRILTRQRVELVHHAASCQQRMEHALVPMNLQLHLVVSDIVGETGLRILEAILQGERDAQALAQLRDGRCRKSTAAQMVAALQGHYPEEGLFVLRQSLDAWKFSQSQLQACDEQILRECWPACLRRVRSRSVRQPNPWRRGTGRNRKARGKRVETTG